MRRLAALVAALVVAAPASARFAPDAAASYRLTIASTRDDGRAVRRTEAAYDIRFQRLRSGWRATLVQLTGGDAISAGFVGLPVAVTLDRDGRALGVADADGWWARLRAGIVAHAPAAAREAMLAAHDATAPVERVRILAGDLLDMCAGADAARRPGERATALPAGGTSLSARETVRRDGSTMWVETRAAGTIGGGAGEIVRRRTIDRRTGLVLRLAEERVVSGASGRIVVSKTTVLTNTVS